MVTPEMIQRINELAHKQKEMPLTAMEKTEQVELRRSYIEHVKFLVRAQLKAASPKSTHTHQKNCSCSHHHEQ